jgi:hypothetical protein
MSDEPGARPVLGIEGQGRGDRTRSALVAVAAETGFGLARDASSNCHSEARRSAPTAYGRTTERASVKEAIADDRAARFKHHLLVLGGDVSSRPGNALSDESRSSFGRRRSSLAVPHGGPDIRGCEVGHPRERSSGTSVSWSMKVRAVASATDNAAARGRSAAKSWRWSSAIPTGWVCSAHGRARAPIGRFQRRRVRRRGCRRRRRRRRPCRHRR